MNYYNTASFGPSDLRHLQSALNQAWSLSQSRDYESDPIKAAAIKSALALRIMQMAEVGELQIQNLVERALMFLPPGAAKGLKLRPAHTQLEDHEV